MATATEEALLAVRNKNLQKEENITPLVESATPPEEQTEATTEPIVASVSNDGEPEVVENDETDIKNWDESEPEVKQTSQPEDFSWVSDQLGEVKTRDEFKTKVSELKTKLKEFEEKPLAGIPDEFKEVIEVAKTGDWKDYLASQLIDYSKLDPIEEFERDFINRAQNNPKYFTDGKYDHQKVTDEIDTLPTAMRELYGSQIIKAEAELAERQRVAIKAKAEQRRTEAEKSLAQSTKSLSEILPLDTYGIKFEPRHSSEMYEGIVSSKLTKKHLGLSYEDLVRSGADMKAITRSITLAEKGEKMIAYKAKNSETKAKKDILTTTQNVQLNTSGTLPAPETQDKKVLTPAEKLRQHLTQSRVGL